MKDLPALSYCQRTQGLIWGPCWKNGWYWSAAPWEPHWSFWLHFAVQTRGSWERGNWSATSGNLGEWYLDSAPAESESAASEYFHWWTLFNVVHVHKLTMNSKHPIMFGSTDLYVLPHKHAQGWTSKRWPGGSSVKPPRFPPWRQSQSYSWRWGPDLVPETGRSVCCLWNPEQQYRHCVLIIEEHHPSHKTSHITNQNP